MRLPRIPPDPMLTFSEVKDNIGLLAKLMQCKTVDEKGRYLHWEEMRYRRPPEGMNPTQWWSGTRLARMRTEREVSLHDKKSRKFTFTPFEAIEENLHWLDINSAGQISANESLIDPNLKDTYLIKSLVDEAINSSQLEGASTTRNVAKEMIRQGRKPKDKSETMILNNYYAMLFIRDVKSESLTVEMIMELHRLLTIDTLEEEKSGRFRTDEDDTHVVNADDEIVHTPPPSDELPHRMNQLCAFANEELDDGFINPIVRAITLHFMLAYDHPFVDGNGRTARALFYWQMARSGYWLIEYISISEVIKRAPTKYGRAYLFTETDKGDLTYFICHQLDVIRQAVSELQKKLEKRFDEIGQAKEVIAKSDKFRNKLNYRQLSLLRHALQHPDTTYRVKEHQNSHGIVYETARRDLVRMSEIGLLVMGKIGNSFVFSVPADLIALLESGEATSQV